MNRRFGYLGLVAIFACIGLLSAARAQQPSLDGTYELIVERSSDIARAIDACVAKMSFIKRPIARGRLSKTNPAYRRIWIDTTDQTIQVQFDERNPVVMPADGSVSEWTREDGETFETSAELKGTELIQRFKAADGQRVNAFRLSEHGGELTLDVTVSSEQLPMPLEYRLVYRRVE